MYILSNDEMKAIDKRAIETFGISGQRLMETAGEKTVEVIEKSIGEVKGKSALVVCGKGNNGGDGFVVARLLMNKGAKVQVLLCATAEEIKGDARIMLDMLPKETEYTSVDRIRGERFDIGVDGSFGTGFKGELPEKVAEIISAFTECCEFIVAIDIPGGVNGTTGETAKGCVKADATATFCCEKYGHRLLPGKAYCGKVTLCDIGIPPEAVESERPKVRLFCEEDMEKLLPPTAFSDHKGTNGKLLIVGGSVGMAGAVCLNAVAAMRSGVGLCYVAVPKSIYTVVATKLTEAMVIPLEDDGTGRLMNAEQISEDIIGGVTGVVVGCGMGVDDNTINFTRQLLRRVKAPLLIDADGINALSRDETILKEYKGRAVITPHSMEMARLKKISLANVVDNRLQTATDFARENNCVVVLKGDGTVTTDGDRTYINTTGNPGMAKGGSGDALSGIIGALLARGLSPVEAGACGVYIHGKAGDFASQTVGMRSMIAGDIIDNIHRCF